MRYRIEHLTDYRYAGTAALTRQALRLSPRSDAHQRVIHWRIRVPGTLTATTDAYSNLNHMHALDAKHYRVRIEIDGDIEVDALADGRLDERDGLPPEIYAATTPLTLADERLTEFAHSRLQRRSAAGLLEFAQAVRSSIDVTHACFGTDTLCRLAVGRDYDNACPVRRVRMGGGDEAMEVALTVRRPPESEDGAQRTRPEEVSA